MSLYSNEIFTKLARSPADIHRGLRAENPSLKSASRRTDHFDCNENVGERRSQTKPRNSSLLVKDLRILIHNKPDEGFDGTNSKTFLIKHALWNRCSFRVNGIVHGTSFEAILRTIVLYIFNCSFIFSIVYIFFNCRTNVQILIFSLNAGETIIYLNPRIKNFLIIKKIK